MKINVENPCISKHHLHDQNVLISQSFHLSAFLDCIEKISQRHQTSHEPMLTLTHIYTHTPLLTSSSFPTRPWGEAAWHQTVIQTLRQALQQVRGSNTER